MNVSVVITCWNGRKLLEKNLPSVIKAAKNLKNNIVEIIVVDDGSTDESVNYLEKIKDQSTSWRTNIKIKLIVQDKNYGYAKTCNTGVENAQGELVAILNLDVVPSKDFLESAIPHFEDEKVFAVSFNEGKFGPGKIIWENGFLGIGSTKLPKKTALTGWASGGSAVFKKNLWEEFKGMDRLFLPFYFEDIDLGIRAYKAGFKCLFEPKSKVEHEHESTINSDNFKEKYISRIKERNRLLLTWKNLDSFDLFYSHLKALSKTVILKPGYVRIILKAIKKIGLIPLFFGKGIGQGNLLSTQQVLKINEKIN